MLSLSMSLNDDFDKVERLLFFKPAAHQLKPDRSAVKRGAVICKREVRIENEAFGKGHSHELLTISSS
jgi:hypothetical protein